jgi:tRNA pseudouridine55 synthase
MAVLDDIKALASASRLFVDEGTAKGNAGVLYGGAGGAVGGERGGRGKWGKGKKATRGRGFAVKIGQGGTLDPLADGVLGERGISRRCYYCLEVLMVDGCLVGG